MVAHPLDESHIGAIAEEVASALEEKGNYMAKVTTIGASSRDDFSSADYWRQRYAAGGNSGAGSYGRLAEYKAGYINDLVVRRGISSVIEFGSGDGNQASLFRFSPYTGIDLSPDAIMACKARFEDRAGWKFHVSGPEAPPKHDMAMSLDVIYHLIEDAVFADYMKRLFDSADRFVLIYASDHEASPKSIHVRHRRFSDWVTSNRPSWTLLEAPDHPFPLRRGGDPKTSSFASFKLFGAT